MKKLIFILLSFTLLFFGCREEEVIIYDLIPMVNLDGTLYLDTGIPADEPNTLDYDGQITSQVDGSQRPTEHQQSNFGTGYDYIFVEEDVVILRLNSGWYFFATEEARQQMQFPLNSKN